MFKSIPNRFNVTLLEEEISRIWKTQRVFEKRRTLRKEAPSFTICERPSAACGKPGLQVVLARVHQDLWLRYKTMRGLHVLRHNGWSTHGLPVELLAENRLGLTGKGQVEQYGIERFNDFCNQLAMEAIQGWKALDERLNGWDVSGSAPVTQDSRSIEAVWALFKLAWDQGLVYQDERVTPYCPHCGTVLADYEIALGTEQIDSLSAIVRLPLLEDPNTTLLVWTDRVWSLPGNVAVAANPDAEYVIVERDLPESEGSKNPKPEKLILAKALLERVFGDEAVRVYETFRGSKLKGLKYRPLFQFLLADKPLHRVIMDEFFVPETGSGMVQLAPAFGAHDLQLAKQNDLPVLMPIGLDGMFVTDVRPWRGVFFKDAEAYIQQDLQERGLLYSTEMHYQNAAFCWGCGSPLLPYVRNAWYLRAQPLGRDWALSRERFWDTPLPLWQCIQCGHQLVVGSVEELSHLAGRNLADMNLHRPFLDEVAFSCPHCDGLMRRLPQVLDAELDAAVLSLLQMPGQEGRACLADLVCEVAGEAEGWFYAVHTLSNLFFDGQAYRRSINLPRLIGARDKQAAKARQALNDPWDVIHDHGADALRWTLLTACSSGDQVEFSNELLAAARNDLLPPLWNVYSLLVNSAAQVGWTPTSAEASTISSLSVLDLWLLSRLHLLIDEMTTALEAYDSIRAASLLQAFITDLAGWYMPRSQRRFAESAAAADRQAACATLYQVLVTLSQLLAPFIPFLAEEFHQKLVRPFDLSAPVSVHLTDWPIVDPAPIDLELNRKMALIQSLASLGPSARQDAGIALHQPLAGAVVTFGSTGEAEALQPFAELLADALHVRKVSYEVDETLPVTGAMRIALDPHLTVELVQEGLADELVRRIQDFRQKAGFPQEAYIHLFINATPRLAGAISALQARIMEGTRCLEIKLVSQPSSQQPGMGSVVEQGGASRRLYTMIEFDGERATFGIEKATDH